MALPRAAGRPFLLLFLVSLTFGSCGKKGEPRPPLPRGPRAVSDLAAEQEGGEAVLTFSYPDRLLTGEPLRDLQTIEVYRVAGATAALAAPRTPPAAPAGPSQDLAPAAAARRAAQAERLAEEAFYHEARRVAALSVAALGEYTRGASVVYRDPLLPLLEKGSLSALAYAVSSVRKNGERSPLSNIVLVTPAVPPGAPELTLVTPQEGRICLEWVPPEKDLLGKPAAVGGYNVYRRALPEEEYAAPSNVKPVSGTAYVDTAAAYGATYFYTVRAILAGKPRVEGSPAPEAGLFYRDIYPPPAPARLDALSEATLVRLVWDPVPASDLAGYLVFRAEGNGAPARLTPKPVTDTFYTDPTVPAGRRYRYSVRAVDTAGNVGPPSPEAVAEPF